MATGNYQERITAAQKNEITEHIFYRKLARATKDAHNREVLLGISRDELSHYRIWKGYTKRDEKPRLFMLWAYYLVSRVLGLTFGIKLMERGEDKAQANYRDLARHVPQAEQIARQEDGHEAALVRMINEERLGYIGSMIRA